MSFSLSNWPMMSAIVVWLLGTYLAVRLYLRDRCSALRFESIGLAVALIPFFLLLGIFVHDLNIHNDKGRPWSPWHEAVFDLFSRAGKPELSIKLPFRSAHYEFDTVHSRTGKYAIYLWTPITLPLHTRSKTDLRIKVRFVDPAGNVVFEQLNFNYPLVWYPSSDRKGWSRAFCFLYRVPSDVPLDIPLKCVIDFDGDVEDFSRNYPSSELTLNRVFYL